MNPTTFMTHTVHVATATGRNSAGELQYGAPVAIKARVQRLSRVVSTGTGQRVTTTHRLLTTAELTETSRVWLPGVPTSSAEGSKVPVSVGAHPHPTQPGLTLYEVDL